MRWSWLALLPLVMGCEALRLSELFPARSRTVAEPPGERCPLGGRVTFVGTDTNANDVLDDDEVTSTEVHCFPMPDLLVTVEPVPFGTRCLGGGQVTRAGHDANGNHTLDPEEVAREVYTCWKVSDAPILSRVRIPAPSPGSCSEPTRLTLVDSGPDENGDKNLDDDEVRTTLTLCAQEAQLLVELDWEPAGEKCAAGGTRVFAGMDQNTDKVLDASEVLASSFICRDRNTFEGDFVVRNDTDLAVLQGIGRIRGTLQFRGGGPSLSQVRVPSLEVVDGAVVIEGNPSLTRMQLPGLRFVGQGLEIRGNDMLETLEVGGASGEKLWVATNLAVESNARLTSLDGLRFVVPRGGVLLKNNAALTQAPESPGLHSIQFLEGALTIGAHGSLPRLPLPNLVRVAGDVVIEGNTHLLTLDGTKLESVGGKLRVNGNPQLPNLMGLSSLQVVSDTLEVRENAGMLNSYGLSSLWHAGSIFFARNDAMTVWGGMPELRSVTTGISVDAHPQLKTIGGLIRLVRGPWLALYDNPKLTALHGLADLEHLRGLSVRRCDALGNLGELAKLRTIESLMVEDNANLTRLGLDNVQEVSSYLSAQRNPRLPTCHVLEFVGRAYTGTPGVLFVADNDDQATCP
ncbi:hypothetical protein [Myxococcus sp. CA040A]|uniref:DUF7151 family protein n=1 Tax=Myxococcus sp. CA040A TaxID=2741738 RepID=UPI00157B6074|nr:hypothetical protein [Myxococcus sp. CA040A]NTX03057.1 hypothetical protein [Myxococcus sp. CA040A]